MDVILHVGAHRTASTSFQHYLRENAHPLERAGIAVWEPKRTRSGLLTGVLPGPGQRRAEDQFRRVRGRILLQLQKAEAHGIRHLVVSDENMIGAPRRNLRTGMLYDDAGARMLRFRAAFGDRVTQVALTVRPQESYWRSVLCFAVMRGQAVPGADRLWRLARGARLWRDVIADLAEALPRAEVQVFLHEDFAGLPVRRLARMTGATALPAAEAGVWLNASPDLPTLRARLAAAGADTGQLPVGAGRWQPFNDDQIATLHEAWEDDLFWLRAGADGLARLIDEEDRPEAAGDNPRAGPMERGHRNGIEERRMA